MAANESIKHIYIYTFIKFLSRLKESKLATVILACIFAFTLFLQCCFFHFQAFHSIMISSLWKDPIAFLTFYAPKISIALFIASFVFLFKRKSWTIYVSFLVSIWCIAELVYYRANGIFLDAFSFTMVGNMDGFWSSVPMYIYISDFILFLISIFFVFSYYILHDNSRNYKITIIAISIAVILNVFTCFSLANFEIKYVVTINPCSKNAIGGIVDPSKQTYLNRFSSIHAFIYDLKEILLLPFENNAYVLSSNEIIQVNKFLNKSSVNRSVSSNIIVILVESFETWTINEKITPNLHKFTSDESSIFYANKIITQTKGGTSADGQMIVNTGLLPINEGAVCYRYPMNVFPSIPQNYKKTAAIVPGSLSVWNQKYMSDSYGITSNYETSTNDADIFNKLIEIYPYNEYTLAITMSSHTPFNSCINREIDIPTTMPELMQNYLKTINYMDENLGDFLSLISKDSILQNSTIVITGDHTIFPSEIRKEFSDYCKANNLDYKVEENYCPLIIYSPNIKEKTIVNDVAYQMDIYPIILHLIGAEDYYWKGFGVNLLDSVARQNRPISPEDAFELSDKLIRANYFKEIESQLSNN